MVSVRSIGTGPGDTTFGRADTGPVCARGRLAEKTIGVDRPAAGKGLEESACGLPVAPPDVRRLALSPAVRPSQLFPAIMPILPPPACPAVLGGLSASELFLLDSVVPGGNPSIPLRVTSVLLPLGVACGGV